jgi:endonuclease-3
MSPAKKAAPARKAAPKTSRPKAKPTLLRPAEIHELFARLAELDPAPKTELVYSTPFELLVAVILSAQATDVGVNKATKRLFPVANTPAKLVALGETGLKRYISTIGLYNAKAANVIAMSRLLIERHGGNVPRTREALEALPGVGPKTAGVVLVHLGAAPAFPVDTHVGRVSRRLGLTRERDPSKVERDLEAIVPEERWGTGHQLFVWHGRRTCKALAPACSRCPVDDLCPKRDVPRAVRR